MLGGFLIGLMMSLTAISDVKLYGIEDHVTLYIGAEIPIKAEVDPAEKNEYIQWILNNPTSLSIKEAGNTAVISPIAEGAVDVMARVDDGSYSSRSIYVQTRHYNASTSDFKVTSGIKPIKQYGINHKTFQVEVNSNLSVAKKEEALRKYLIAMSDEGDVTVRKASLFNDYFLYSLSVAGYPNESVEVRIDKRQAGSQNLIYILENISQLTEEAIQQEQNQTKPELETEHSDSQNQSSSKPNQTQSSQTKPESNTATNQEDAENNGDHTDIENSAQKPTTNQPITSETGSNDEAGREFEKIRDSFSEVEGMVGTGTKHDPFQITQELLLTHANVLEHLKAAWAEDSLKLESVTDDMGFKRYKMKFMSRGLGSANEFYIELLIPLAPLNKSTEDIQNLNEVDFNINHEAHDGIGAEKEMTYSSVIRLKQETKSDISNHILMEMVNPNHLSIQSHKEKSYSKQHQLYYVGAASFLMILCGYFITLRKKQA